MKSTQIAKKYNIDVYEFEACVKESKLDYFEGLSSMTIDDANVMKYYAMFMDYKKRERDKQEELARKEAEWERERAELKKKKAEQQAQKEEDLSKILFTSGYNFEGYKIAKYSEYISSDAAVQVPRSGAFGGDNESGIIFALGSVKRQALRKLRETAYDLGCNAVIGVDFDYITLEPETANYSGGTLYEPYIIGVAANGNAVIIEKIEE